MIIIGLTNAENLTKTQNPMFEKYPRLRLQWFYMEKTPPKKPKKPPQKQDFWLITKASENSDQSVVSYSMTTKMF